MDRFVVISGCSGGGKSTLIAELAQRGFATVKEPGRRVVEAELALNGSAVPWLNLEAFLRRAIDLALTDRDAARANTGTTFFDRGLVDAASALEALTGEPAIARYCHEQRYAPRIFLAPPWPEIYAKDTARHHDLASAIAEYQRLAWLYPQLGYDVRSLPKLPIAERADFILDQLTLAITPS